MPEERCRELDNYIESLSEGERKLVLWLLLEEHTESLRKELTYASKEEYLRYLTIKNHLKVAKEIHEILGFELWG